MEVHARVVDDAREAARSPNTFQANSLLSNIERNVYPTYFSRLEELHKGGRPVDFQFRTMKEQGPRLR